MYLKDRHHDSSACELKVKLHLPGSVVEQILCSKFPEVLERSFPALLNTLQRVASFYGRPQFTCSRNDIKRIAIINIFVRRRLPSERVSIHVIGRLDHCDACDHRLEL